MKLGRRALPAVAAVLLLAATATGCSRTGSDRTLDLGASGSASPGATTGSVQKWIAVFRTEADPGDMSEDAADVLAIAGGSIVESPAACFEGLPADIPLDSYLLGVVAPTKDVLDGIVTEVDRPVIFEGQVRTMCLD
ncbi:MAG: hypothetical protein ABI595_13315 [Actinomycetota bacterium]